jgi:uncharacterized pyridoxal phosphate-dependent enzyme
LKRRALIKNITVLPFIGGVGAGSPYALQGAVEHTGEQVLKEGYKENIYEALGVKTVINGRGTVTIIGASRMLPEVERAMKAATRHYVQIDELMDAVAARLGQLTGSEWGIVTTGATGALTVAAAGVVTGGDPDKLWKLPDLNGMKDEVIIPTYSWTAYESAVRGVGVKMIEVENAEQLKSAINHKTAMVLVLAGRQSEEGPLSVKNIAGIVKSYNIPILVDAAAEGLSLPNPHLAQGADMVAYSGGKYLNGPQCSGLLIGRKDLVRAAWVTSAPHHGFGRGYKVGREEIMGMLTAVEMWWKRDHTAEQRKWESRLHIIATALDKIPGVTTEVKQPAGRSNPSPDLYVKWDQGTIPLTGYDVENLLWAGSPGIAVSGAGSYLPFPPNFNPGIVINSSQLEDGEEKIIADRVYKVLSKPPVMPQNNAPAKVNISGKWDVDILFAAATGKQQMLIEQEGNTIKGTHFGSYAARELSGTINGSSLLLRSSYIKQGVRLNFEFTGVAETNIMKGTLMMGEYGLSEWKATRIV